MKKTLDSFLSYEEDFHGSDRKLSRNERKKAKENDRSKYKKTDQDQKKKNPLVIEQAPPSALKGRVLAIYPEEIHVESQHTLYRCQVKGSLKKEKNSSKNLVTIGDFVLFEEREKLCGLIFQVEPRRTILSRSDNLHRHKEQLIAANVDQVIITASMTCPPLKPFLLDRYIIAAQKGKMKPIIVINKIDLVKTDEDRALLDVCQEAYEALGIPFLRVSAATGEGIKALKKYMENTTSVFSGQSGTGKSSLINATCNLQLKTGDVIEKTAKGSHTTTRASLCPLENGGFCVDTPGIKSFGVWDLKLPEIEQFFTEIAQKAGQCRFLGCSHDTEPDCAVKEAIQVGEISPLRLASYHALASSLKEKHQNR
jgi:ribosome biogenesis GTPase / thiamine phosphate phosphatase